MGRHPHYIATHATLFQLRENKSGPKQAQLSILQSYNCWGSLNKTQILHGSNYTYSEGSGPFLWETVKVLNFFGTFCFFFVRMTVFFNFFSVSDYLFRLLFCKGDHFFLTSQEIRKTHPQNL